MYDVHIEVESLVYIYVYVGSRTIFFPVLINSLWKKKWFKTSTENKSCMVNLALHLKATIKSNLMHGIMCTLSFILVLQLHLAAWQHYNSCDYLMMVLQVHSDLCVWHLINILLKLLLIMVYILFTFKRIKSCLKQWNLSTNQNINILYIFRNNYRNRLPTTINSVADQ